MNILNKKGLIERTMNRSFGFLENRTQILNAQEIFYAKNVSSVYFAEATDNED